VSMKQLGQFFDKDSDNYFELTEFKTKDDPYALYLEVVGHTVILSKEEARRLIRVLRESVYGK